MTERKKIIFATSNPEIFEEVARLLAEWKGDLKLKVIDPFSISPTTDIVKEVSNSVKLAFKEVKPSDGTFAVISEISGLILDDKFYSFNNLDDGAIEKFVCSHLGSSGVAVVVVGYTIDGKNVSTFRGEIKGKVVQIRGEKGGGFEKFWQPSGYSKTLSEMFSYKHLVNMRHEPYLKIANDLRGYDFSGLFEIHVTVKSPINLSDEERENFHGKFKELCKTVKCKPVLIELPKGTYPTQMMTSSYQRGKMYNILVESFRISQEFAKAGFEISRTKIECMFSNEGVPKTDSEAREKSKQNYFEFHIKLELNEEQYADLTPLKEICSFHNAHLSRNAFKNTLSGNQERFLTMRCYSIGKETALAQFESCVATLQKKGFKIHSKQREYSVYDSNVNLDVGWMEKTET